MNNKGRRHSSAKVPGLLAFVSLPFVLYDDFSLPFVLYDDLDD